MPVNRSLRPTKASQAPKTTEAMRRASDAMRRLQAASMLTTDQLKRLADASKEKDQ